MAEALLEEIVRNEGEGDDWWIDSAGVSAFDGETATNNTQIVAAERGLDLSSHRSKLATRPVIEPVSLVLVMEERHRKTMHEAYPEYLDRVYLLKEMSGGTGDVHDPIGADIVKYRAMADEVNSILMEGLDRIRELADEGREKTVGDD